MVRLYLVSKETDKLSSKVTEPFCVPTRNERECLRPSPCGVLSDFWMLAILIGE